MKSEYIQYGEEVVFRAYNTSYLKCELDNTNIDYVLKLNSSDNDMFRSSIDLQEIWSIVKLGTPYIPVYKYYNK